MELVSSTRTNPDKTLDILAPLFRNSYEKIPEEASKISLELASNYDAHLKMSEEEFKKELDRLFAPLKKC